MGDQEKGRLPKKLKSSMDVPNVAQLKVQVLSFSVNLIFSPLRVHCQSYPFRDKFGKSGKCRSPKKLQSLLEVPYAAHLKEQVLSFNTNPFSAM